MSSQLTIPPPPTTLRFKIASEIPSQNQTGNNTTGFDHVFLNPPQANRPSAVENNNSRPSAQRPQTQFDPFQDAISRLRNAPATSNNNNNNNALGNQTRITFPALPPPPDTRPQARPTFRPPPHPDTYRRSSIPNHFGPQMATNSNHPTTDTTQQHQTHQYIPFPVTPEMNNHFALDELEELLATASPSKSGLDLPDFGVFGPNANEVANMLLSQSDIYGTPQLLQTPSMVEASPDLELIAPLYGNRKHHHGTPSMSNLTLTPTMASPHTTATGLYDMPGQFGFFESSGGNSMPYDSNGSIEDILSLVNTFNHQPMQSTISPSDVYLTPGLPYTPGQLLDTPSVGTTSPLLDTPGRPDVPLGASAAYRGKRASPMDTTKSLSSPAKRNRSEEMDGDAQSAAAKKRKHTGTRPGISSTQLLPPGAPPQMKTYLTESSTSRKDVPASYKVKAGGEVDNSTISKIVAKRTANRDSARRSRHRKQQAMEIARGEINYLNARVEQLENFLREKGYEPPQAPIRSPQQEYEEEFD